MVGSPMKGQVLDQVLHWEMILIKQAHSLWTTSNNLRLKMKILLRKSQRRRIQGFKSSLSSTLSKLMDTLNTKCLVLMMKVSSLRLGGSRNSMPWPRFWERDGQVAMSHQSQRRPWWQRCSSRKIRSSLRKEGVFWRDLWRSVQSLTISFTLRNSRFSADKKEKLTSSFKRFRNRHRWQFLISIDKPSRLMRNQMMKNWNHIMTKSDNSRHSFRNP